MVFFFSSNLQTFDFHFLWMDMSSQYCSDKTSEFHLGKSSTSTGSQLFQNGLSLLLKPQSVIYADVRGVIFKNFPAFCSYRLKEGRRRERI